MAVTADKPAPYTTPSAILDVIDRFRTRGLPSPINADVLGRASISAGLIPRTLQALQTLDLIDEDGKPTSTFEGIRLAPEVEYKKRLEDWLKAAYADVFAFVDPSKDSGTQIRDAFRSYTPVGQQERMVTLFVGLCAAAGLAPEKATTQARPASRSSNRPFVPLNRRGTATLIGNAGRTTKTTQSDIPPSIAGLLANLPADGWTKTDRDRFLKTFEAVLDYEIPVIARKQSQEDE